MPCSFNPDDNNIGNLGRIFCPFHADLAGDIQTQDGRFWCGLHVPIDAKLENPAHADANIGYAHGRIPHILGAHRNEIVNFRRTVLRHPLNFGDIGRTIGISIPGMDFSEAIFLAPIKWNGARIERRVSFDSATFHKSAEFKSLKAEGISFVDSEFLDSADFSGANLNGPFKGVKFRKAALFSGLDRISELKFSGAEFAETLDISGQTINGPVDFSHSTCGGDLKLPTGTVESVNFTGADIKGKLTLILSVSSSGAFDGAKIGEVEIHAGFGDDANFRNLHVTKRGDFSKSQFLGTANFDGCRLDGMVDFLNATFRRKARFHNVRFGSDVRFRNAVFFDDVEFVAAIFSGDVDFLPNPTGGDTEKDNFQGLLLDDAKFLNRTRFKNRKFSRYLHCRRTQFSIAPDFHGCTFHQDTTFNAATFLDTSSESSADSYRTLKVAMESLKSRHEEARFFMLEQRSLRNLKIESRLVRFASWVYDISSEYGTSISRPAFGFFLSFLIFFSLYVGIDFSRPESCSVLEAAERAFRFTVTQVVKPFDAMLIKQESKIGNVHIVVASFAAIQTITHITLFALLLFAIRRRFKLD